MSRCLKQGAAGEVIHPSATVFDLPGRAESNVALPLLDRRGHPSSKEGNTFLLYFPSLLSFSTFLLYFPSLLSFSTFLLYFPSLLSFSFHQPSPHSSNFLSSEVDQLFHDIDDSLRLEAKLSLKFF